MGHRGCSLLLLLPCHFCVKRFLKGSLTFFSFLYHEIDSCRLNLACFLLQILIYLIKTSAQTLCIIQNTVHDNAPAFGAHVLELVQHLLRNII